MNNLERHQRFLRDLSPPNKQGDRLKVTSIIKDVQKDLTLSMSPESMNGIVKFLMDQGFRVDVDAIDDHEAESLLRDETHIQHITMKRGRFKCSLEYNERGKNFSIEFRETGSNPLFSEYKSGLHSTEEVLVFIKTCLEQAKTSLHRS